jgi:hypothetical protein
VQKGLTDWVNFFNMFDILCNTANFIERALLCFFTAYAPRNSGKHYTRFDN